MRMGLIVAVAMLLSSPFGRVTVAATHPAIAPNQDFPNPTLQIRAPASSGWYGISQTPSRIEFGKHGDDPDETFAAAVFLFRIPALAMSADAIIDVSCGAEPLLNNCRTAQKCSGRAVAFIDPGK